MTERQLQSAVVELATLLGYAAYHTHDSRRSQPGYPDLTLAKGRRLIFAELKTAKGRVKPLQQEWLNRLERTGAESYVWRPADWNSGAIEETLRRSGDSRTAGEIIDQLKAAAESLRGTTATAPRPSSPASDPVGS